LEGPPMTSVQSGRRTVGWFSAGVASAVACATVPVDVIARCDTGSEHEDNDRFFWDCVNYFGWRDVHVLKSEKYADVWEVWEDKQYIAGINGAPCTGALKVLPRLAFQRPDDIHIFGYTADTRDANRFEAFKEAWPDMTVRAPLIERGITKKKARALIQGMGLQEPLTYKLGMPNANCIPCGKATSIKYWALMRRDFPAKFDRIAELSRRLGARLTRLKGERIFLDEIPLDTPCSADALPPCDIACELWSEEIERDHRVDALL